MSRVFAICNQKGGVGKTTTAVNLASCLAERKKKVLAVDLDPQGNMSSGLGCRPAEGDNTIYEILIGEAAAKDCIRKSEYKNLDVLPSNVQLSGAEVELSEEEDRPFLLRDALAGVRDEYDYIIIDAPPSLNMLAINGMTAADSVIIPIQCEYYALEGLSQLMQTIDLVKERLHPELAIEGVLLTMYDTRTNLSAQVADNVRENLDQRIYKTVIPRNVRLAEAPSYGMPINYYDRFSAGARAYKNLAKEIIRGGEK